MNFWQRMFSRKYSEARQVMVVNQVGQSVATPRNYKAFADEGYKANVIGYKCISLISKSCASIEWELYKGDTEIESHPILDLLKNPNPLQSRAAFFEALIAYYLLSGNSYTEAIRPNGVGAPIELWTHRPDMMKIIAGVLGLPQAFVFKSGGNEKVWPVNQITGQGDILHMKTFNPTDNWYGMSPIEAATLSVDQHNESAKWNLSLLQNKGTPSGAFVVGQSESNPSGVLPDGQFQNMQEMIKSKVQGSSNAGRVMLLEGGLDWKQMGFSASDMDWLQGRNMSAREIALAFGVPPILLNIAGDATFSNYKEARAALYEDTILPILDLIADEMNHWLLPMFKAEGLELYYDKDEIPALEVKRAEMFTQVSSAGFLTANEKRAVLGYDAIDGGDILFVNSGQIPISDVGMLPDEVQSSDPALDSLENESGQTEKDSAKHHKFNHKFSQINRINGNEKQQSATQAFLIKEKFVSAMYHDLVEEFKAQSKQLKNGLDNLDPRTMEFAAVKIISDNTEIPKIIKKHSKRALLAFGLPILNGAKSIGITVETKNTVKFQHYVGSFIDRHTADAIKHIEGTSIKRARRIIKDTIAGAQESGASSKDIANEIAAEFDTVSTSRANMIARTEIAIASNNGSLEAAKSLEIPDLMKEWVSVNDDRTRDTKDADHVSVNGQQIPLNEKFSVNPDASMEGPCDPSAEPEQIINCRCVLVYAREGKSLIPTYEVK